MVQFKLLHRGLVRKVTFKNVDQPSWHELSWKIGDVCNIPHAAVALTYLDPDGDKITISSQAELREYYSALDEDDMDPSVPHKAIVRNLNEGVPDDEASDPREDSFLMRDAQTMAASTVGGGSQWGVNPEDEAERDPNKLRLSGYSTFADALSPLARSAGGTDMEDASSPEKEDLPGGFKPSPSPQPDQNKNSGGGSWFGGWGKVLGGSDPAPSTTPAPPPPPPPPIPPEATKSIPTNANSNSRLAPDSNPWVDGNVTKTPAWAASTTPTSTSKAPSLPWAPPSHVATGALKGSSRGQPPQQQTQPKMFPQPVAATVQMDSMVADRATTYEGSPAVLATVPRGRKNKKKLEKAAKEEEARRAAGVTANPNPTGSRFEELELKAMEREAAREREDNARASAEAATRAATEEQRRHEQHEWERERERLEKIKVDEKPRDGHQFHQRGVSDLSHSSEWEHVQSQSPQEEDEQAYRERIAAARANVFGTSAADTPTIRQRKSSTKSKDKTGKSSRPNSKVFPPTPAPKKFYDSDLAPGNGMNGAAGSAPPTPGVSGPPNTAQVCNDVADLLVSFGRILDNERDLLDAIRETFSSGPHAGALGATFGNRNLSPEMLRIVASVDDLLTRILPYRPAPSPPYASTNMELEPRVPTPSVTPTPVNPADPEFGVPKSEFATSFEFANRGRQQGAPIINVPRPKYPASSLTREGYSTGTTPPSQNSYGYSASPYLTASPDKSARTRSRSRPPPNDFDIVPPSFLPPQARVIPPPVVPGEETDDSPMTPDASRGFTRQSAHDGGLVLANQSQRPADMTKADMETARHHYKSQRELYKLERAERKKEIEERAAAKAERKRARAAASNDPNIADLTNQLQGLVPPRPYEAERRYIESPYEAPRTARPYPGSQASTVFAEGLGQVTLVPPIGFQGSNSAVTAPVSPVHDEPSTQSFDRARRRRQSLNGGVSPERYSHSRPPPSGPSRNEGYHADAYPGGAHHAAPYAQAQPQQQDLAKRVALRLTELGYTPQKYPTLPSIVGHRIRPLMNTPGVNENELAYHIVQDLFKYSGRGQA